MTRVEAHVHIGRARKGLDACISLREVPKGKVVHASWVSIKTPRFAVQPAGLRRFRETGQKNVHAYVRGECEHWDSGTNYDDPFVWVNAGNDKYREVVYNPKVNITFVDKESGHPVMDAKQAILIGKRVFYR